MPKIKVNKKPKKVKTALVKAPTRRIKDPVGYYECLCQQAQSGFQGKKITQACRECKHLAPALSAQRVKEIKKLTQAYKQIGVSLSKLLSQ